MTRNDHIYGSDTDMMLYYMLKSCMPRSEDIPVINRIKGRIEDNTSHPYLDCDPVSNAIFYSGRLDDIIPITRSEGGIQYTTPEFIDTLKRWGNAYTFRDVME